MRKFYPIRHVEIKDGKAYSSYLGDVQLDVPHTTRFYSKNTNEIVEVTVNEFGEIHKRVTKSKARITCPDAVAVIEER